MKKNVEWVRGIEGVGVGKGSRVAFPIRWLGKVVFVQGPQGNEEVRPTETEFSLPKMLTFSIFHFFPK